jgi:diacylglycerol kinase (ATP)
MPAKVILNPYAGRWLARQRWPEAEAALKATGIQYELDETGGPGEGIALAADAVRAGFSPVISAGGDGSISEVVNGILQASQNGQAPPLGIIPLGSANDLVDNLGLPKNLGEAARIIAEGRIRYMDVGLVNGRYFDNNAAIGLEPYITLIQQRYKRLRGPARYLAATLRGIANKPEWHMRLEWDGGGYEGPVSLVTVGNAPRTGGLFYMTPHADPFDGKLTFVHAYLASRAQILRILPRTMKPAEGSYVENPAVHEINCTWLKIHSDQPTPAHADGEIFAAGIHELEYGITASRLPVLMP